ncbi:MAG: UDP-2,3-diacylglucosamine diphosphatase [Dokdonella sp.]|nr:UDP-2,3-diacylglucosamine diphosphatase [Dokdonella sp.]
MATLFISDLHLDPARPAIIRQFLAFAREQAAQAEALYILGDFFEAWIGDDAAGELEDSIATALAQLHEQGVPVYFMHGNRDFLLGDAWARRARLTLLPDPSVVEIAGEQILLMHGDLLCTDDAKYQAFRTQTRAPHWQRAFLAKPLTERQAFAAQARAESQRYTRARGEALTDVNADAVSTTMHRFGVRTLIHGHTHRPALHELAPLGLPGARRIVLGDWYEQGSLLEVDANGCRLRVLPAAATATPAH